MDGLAGSNNGYPSKIKELIGKDIDCQSRLSSDDRERIFSIYSILNSSYADITDFIDKDDGNNPYFIVKSNKDDDIREETYELYKLMHHYLASLYSFNETIRVTITDYLPRNIKLDIDNFSSENKSIEYINYLVYLRGLRIAAQHGVFSDCFITEQWDKSSNRYRIKFCPSKFSQHNRINNPGQYLRYSKKRFRNNQ